MSDPIFGNSYLHDCKLCGRPVVGNRLCDCLKPPTGRYPHKPPPTNAAWVRGPRAPFPSRRSEYRSNLVRLFFGTLRIVANFARKMKETRQ